MTVKNINYNVYGDKSTWYENKYNNYITYNPTWGKGGNNVALSYGYLFENKIHINEKIDDSICPFGIAGDCDIFAHNAVIWNEGEEVKKITEIHNTGEIMYLSTLSDNTLSFYDNIQYFTRSTSNYTRWSPRATRSGNQQPKFMHYTTIALDFDYNKTIILIMVTAISSDFSSCIQTSLNDYITNHKSTHPLICGYYPVIYKGTLNQRERGTKGIRIVLPYTQMPPFTTEDYNQIKDGIISYAFCNNLSGAGMNGNLFSDSSIPFHTSSYKNSTINYFNGSPFRWELRDFTDKNNRPCKIPIYTGTIEEIYRQASFWGLYFTDRESVAKTAVLGEKCVDENVYLPVIDDGVLKGDYKRGKDTTTLYNSKIEYGVREKSGYKGFDNIDPTKYTDKISLNNPKLTSAGAFNTFYALSESELKSFANELWTADESKFNQIIQGLMLMGENPMDGIISLQLYPFSLINLSSLATTQPIQIGRTQLNTSATKIKGLNAVIDLGSINLRNYFDSFLDYEPYSTATLYIPYCGSIQLSLNDTTGKTISVKLIVDYNSGICTAVVFSDGIPIVYKNGVIGQQISVTGTDNATMASNAISSSLNMLNSATNFIAGGKDVSSTIQNSANLLASSFDYSAMRTIYQNQGANSSQINMYQPQKPHIIINLAEFDVADDFGKYHGFRCDFYEFINSLNGYVETDTPILTNINATEDEKNIIIELMRGGFYV